MALSTTEYGYIAVTEAIKETIWLQGILLELKLLDQKVIVFSDNQSALHLCKNPFFHETTKHIDIRHHFIREKVDDGVMKVDKISIEENPADMGTKVLTLGKFKHFLELLKIGEG